MPTKTLRSLPDPKDEEAVKAEGLYYVDDGPHCLHHRWRQPGMTHGILYASHLPFAWGVYWQDGAHGIRYAWTHECQTAIQLLGMIANCS